MSVGETARQRARREITREIVEEARRQLATEGAAGLSLRSVARELGMVSSGIYRYFPSRDELLTALIVEAYDSLGEAAEVAATRDGTPRQRWIATCRAIRSWAIAHPHEYALVFGTPVPGYAAPEQTTRAGTRATLALLGILGDAGIDDDRSVPPPVEPMMERVAEFGGIETSPATLLAAVTAWTQLYGIITFELFGQTRGLAEDREALFDATIEVMADVIGLR